MFQHHYLFLFLWRRGTTVTKPSWLFHTSSFVVSFIPTPSPDSQRESAGICPWSGPMLVSSENRKESMWQRGPGTNKRVGIEKCLRGEENVTTARKQLLSAAGSTGMLGSPHLFQGVLWAWRKVRFQEWLLPEKLLSPLCQIWCNMIRSLHPCSNRAESLHQLRQLFIGDSQGKGCLTLPPSMSRAMCGLWFSGPCLSLWCRQVY